MASLTLRANGPASAPAVWEAYADPQRWSEWARHIHRVEAVGRLRPGLAGKVFNVVPPPYAFEVTNVDASRRLWSWSAAVGPIRMSFDHGVDASEAGSGTWLTMRGPLVLLVLYAPVARLSLHRLVRTSAP